MLHPLSSHLPCGPHIYVIGQSTVCCSLTVTLGILHIKLNGKFVPNIMSRNIQILSRRLFSIQSQHFPRKIYKTLMGFIQDSWPPTEELKPKPPECKGVLKTRTLFAFSSNFLVTFVIQQ
jgi:hypothetical protein